MTEPTQDEMVAWCERRAEFHESEAANDPDAFASIKKQHADSARMLRAIAAALASATSAGE